MRHARFDPFNPAPPLPSGPPRLVEEDDVLQVERPMWVRVGAGALALGLLAGSLAGLVEWDGGGGSAATTER